MKHGGTGGSCRRWKLNDSDYITRIEYTYHQDEGYVTGVKFLTKLGQLRTIGRESSGRRVSYNYNEEKKFLGFMSYEVNDKTYAIGAYDSVCNHLAESELPQESLAVIKERMKAVGPEAKEWDEPEASKRMDPFEEAFQEAVIEMELEADSKVAEPRRERNQDEERKSGKVAEKIQIQTPKVKSPKVST